MVVQIKVDWQFTTDKTNIKLKRLYPASQKRQPTSCERLLERNMSMELTREIFISQLEELVRDDKNDIISIAKWAVKLQMDFIYAGKVCLKDKDELNGLTTQLGLMDMGYEYEMTRCDLYKIIAYMKQPNSSPINDVLDIIRG